MAKHNRLEFEAASELLSLVDRPRTDTSVGTSLQSARAGWASSSLSHFISPQYEPSSTRPHPSPLIPISAIPTYEGFTHRNTTHELSSPPGVDEFCSGSSTLFSPLSLSRTRDERPICQTSRGDLSLDQKLEEEYARHRRAISTVCLPLLIEH
jgi:hypothetical protein